MRSINLGGGWFRPGSRPGRALASLARPSAHTDLGSSPGHLQRWALWPRTSLCPHTLRSPSRTRRPAGPRALGNAKRPYSAGSILGFGFFVSFFLFFYFVWFFSRRFARKTEGRGRAGPTFPGSTAGGEWFLRWPRWLCRVCFVLDATVGQEGEEEAEEEEEARPACSVAMVAAGHRTCTRGRDHGFA